MELCKGWHMGARALCSWLQVVRTWDLLRSVFEDFADVESNSLVPFFFQKQQEVAFWILIDKVCSSSALLTFWRG